MTADRKKRSATKAARSAVCKGAEKVKGRISEQAEETKEQARVKAIEAALGLVDLQQKTFDGAFKFIGQFQNHSEKAVKEAVHKAEWLPEEGKSVVDEWVKTLHKGRSEFQKTVDKSFDLMADYLERVKEEDPDKPKKKAKSKSKAKSKTKAKAKTKSKAKTKTKKKSAAKSKAKTKTKTKAKAAKKK